MKTLSNNNIQLIAKFYESTTNAEIQNKVQDPRGLQPLKTHDQEAMKVFTLGF